MRTKTYDYDSWLAQGLRLVDYDFATEEYILGPSAPTITPQQARLLSYNSVDELTPEQVRIIWGGDTEK